MINIIIIAAALIIVVGATIYVFRQKKKGCKCIGCPHADNCKHNCE